MTRSIFTSMVLGASLLSGAAMHAATPATTSSQIASPVHATLSHAKLVHFSLRNDTATPIKVLAGEQTMTLLPGKTVAVKLPSGLNIVAAEATPNRVAGSVLLQVSDALGDSTVSLQ